jgi:hypothetical protein
MAPLPQTRFRRALARRNREAAAAFVAALFDARGFETTLVDGGAVRVVDGDDSRLFVVAGDGPPTDADVVVDPRGGAARRDAAADAGADYLGPGALYRALLYAVDRDAAATVVETHLGVPFDADAPGSRLDGAITTLRNWTADAPAVTLVALALVVAAVGGALTLAGTDPLSGEAPAADAGVVGDAGSGGPTGAAVGGVTDSGALPPGLGSDGVENVTALAEAHRNATDGRAYEVLVLGRGQAEPIRHRPQLASYYGRPPPWYRLRQRISVERPTVYRSRVTGVRAARGNGTESVVYDDYADGVAVYRRVGGENVSPRFDRSDLRPGIVADGTAAYVTRYLRTTNATVERVGTNYRVTATGTPRYLAGDVTDYAAVAWVSPEGVVFRLEVTYDPADSGARTDTRTPSPTSVVGDQPHTFAMIYEDIGEQTVSRPYWYDRARNATTDATHPAGVAPGTASPLAVDALAESHGAAVRAAPYEWRVEHDGSHSGGLVDGRWYQSRQTARVESPTVYAFSVAGAYWPTEGDRRSLTVDVYADGQYRYRATEQSEGLSTGPPPTYERAQLAPEPTDPFAPMAERYVRRYLSAPTVAVSVENDGARRYRVVATGTPERLPDRANASDYRAVALVRPSGLVESLSVEYDRTGTDADRVGFRFDYVGVNDTTVEVPFWYRSARRATGADTERTNTSD